MKRIRKILMMLMVLPGFLIQAQTIQMRMPDLTPTQGDVVSMPVYVDNSVTGLNVLSYQLVISFNSNLLSVIDVSVSGTMSAGWGTPVYNVSSPGYLNIANAGASPLSGTGVLLNINFSCNNTGYTAVSFYNGTANNYFNEGTPLMAFDDGTINIGAPPSITVYPNSALLAVGETQQFTVSGGTAPYSWSLTDPTVGNIDGGGLFTATGVGFTKVKVQDDNGIMDETNDYVEVRAMKLTLPNVSEWQGGTIEIPINTTSLTGFNIKSGEIRFSFNGNILTPTGFNTSGTLLQGYSNILLNTTVPGQVTLAFAGTTALSGSGELIRVVFDISSTNTGNTGLNFNYATFNETLQAETVNGYFTMITFGNIYISPNTYSIVAGQTKTFTASGGVPPYTWSSSDNTVASIDNSGLLTAHKSGVIQLSVVDDVGATGTSGNITVYDTYVALPSVNATLGSLYDMPVLIGPIPSGQDVFSIQGTITFKSPELTAVDIITTGTLTSGWAFAKNITSNSITFAGAGTLAFSSPGVMFKIRFQLNPELTNGEFAYVNFSNILLNEGIPLPQLQNGGITGTGGIVVNLKALLEGPWNGSTMSTDLNPAYIPHGQPYNTAPWYYSGSENISALPNALITDWVLVELRQTTGGPSSATPSTLLARQAAFLLNNGNIVAVDGVSNLVFGVGVTSNLYAVIWHRNHLGIMSAVPLTLSGGIYSYDFTTAASQAYLSGQTSLGGGKYGMYAGNADGSGMIDATDITVTWNADAANSGYYDGDMDMDSQVNNQDKNDVWRPNNGTGDQVPD